MNRFLRQVFIRGCGFHLLLKSGKQTPRRRHKGNTGRTVGGRDAIAACRPCAVGRSGRHLDRKVDAGRKPSTPSRVAISAASLRRPRTDDGFMGYPKNKTVKLLARTRARKFLVTGGLEQMAGATSKTKATYSPAISWQKESKNLNQEPSAEQSRLL